MLNRLTYTALPNGGTLNYAYPSTTEVDVYQDQNAAGDRALRTQTLADGFGRQVWSNIFETASQYIATTQAYDALGRVVQTTNPSRQNPADGLGLQTVYGYDSLGRQISVKTPDGMTAATGYSGNATTVTDQAGKKRKLMSDGLDRLTDVYEDPAGSNFHTNYIVDPLNNVRTVAQGAQTRGFVYDTLNRLTSAANPESGTAGYTYDSVGNMLKRTDARGFVTTTSYDALNRPATVATPTGRRRSRTATTRQPMAWGN